MNAQTKFLVREVTGTGVVILLCSSLLAQQSLRTGAAQVSKLPYAQSKTVDVIDPQPIAAAAQQIEAIYGWPITYEDPITVNASQLEDITEKVQRTPNPSHRVIVQKEEALSFTYKVPPPLPSAIGEPSRAKQEREAAVEDALASVLDGYAASGSPINFAVTEEDGIFHIVPTNFLDQEGNLRQTTAILDTRITILPKERNRVELLNEICQSLSKSTGIHVGIGNFPGNQGSYQAQGITTISGFDVPARALLSQLLAELGAAESEDFPVEGPKGERLTRHRVV